MSDRLDVAYVEILPDFSRFNRAVRGGLDRLSKDIGSRLTSAFKKVEDDIAKSGDNIDSSLQRSMGNVEKSAEGAADSVSKVGDSVRTSFEDAEATVNKSTKSIERDSDRIGRTAGSVFDRIRTGVDKLRTSFSGLSDRLFSLQGRFVVMGSVITLAVVAAIGAVDELLGLLATAPALAAVAAAGFATIAVVTNGMSDAFAAAFEDAEKFEESIANLAPSAQAVAREFRALVPNMRSLRSEVQEAAFSQLNGDLTAIAQNLGGAVRQGMVDAATALGGLANEAAEFGQQAATARTVELAFDAVEAVFLSLGGAIQPFLEGMRILADEFLPRITSNVQSIEGFAVAFRNWAAEAVATGSAVREVQEAMTLLGDLVGTTRNLAGAVENIGDAADRMGIRLTQTLEDITADFEAFFETADGQRFAENFIIGVDRITRGIAPIIGTIAMQFANLTNPLADIVDSIGPDLQEIFTGIGEGIGAFLREAQPFFEALASLLAEVDWAQLGESLGKAFADVGEALNILNSEIDFAELSEGLGFIIEVIGQFIVQLVLFLNSIIQLFLTVSNAFDSMGEASSNFADRWAEFWLGIFIEAPSNAITAFTEMIGEWIANAGAQFSGFRERIGELWRGLWSAMRSTVSNTLGSIRESVGNRLSGILSFITGWGSDLAGWWNGFWARRVAPVANAMGSVRSAVSNAVSSISSRLSSLRSSFSSVFSRIVTAVQTARSRVSAALSAIRSAVSTAQTLAGTLSGLTPFADGGTVYGPTQALIGEAGPEVVIPLTKPARAAQLAEESGLLRILGGQVFGNMSAPRTSAANNGSATTTIERGAVVIQFGGVPTSDEQARRVGQAAGEGLMNTLAARNARLGVKGL